ncbi:MAG TPA: putative transporter [Ferruginibacter sp.]|nr:putative transporter [Ferruginibacter sp.]HPH90617.1 putative transporter [Ferruginibacter sp.]
MNNWFTQLFTSHSIAQTVLLFGLVISVGIWLGRLKIAGISLGVTWVLFTGMFLSYLGITVDEKTEHFLKEFGLVLFVYSIGLQVGPGFFASLKKYALNNNLLAVITVSSGVLITVILFYISGNHITIMAGIMSGAVTNTPGLAAAQAAVSDLNITGTDKTLITLAYAVAYPFGVFGIIASLLLLKKIWRINIPEQQELHRRLNALRSNKPVSHHYNLENTMLIGQPLIKLFEMLKEKIIVSRMLHQGQIITPTPHTILAEHDVLLIVASKKESEQLKLIVGSYSEINLKDIEDSDLIARTIIVTKKSVTHKRLGDLPVLNQQNFTMTRLNRAGIEMVPHGDIFLQLGDSIKVVGTEAGVQIVSDALGNSLKKLDAPDLAPIFIGIVLGVILGSIPFHFPGMPVAVKIGMAGGPLIVALLLSRFGNVFYLNNYTTNSANLMIRELGITLFLAAVGLSSGKNLSVAFADGKGFYWIIMGIAITVIPLLIAGLIARKFFRKTYFEICGLLAGASTDPPALAFATKLAGSDIPSITYATVYPITMILRIVAAQILILFFS